MNFKDLQYSIGRLTTDVRSQLARNNPLQKQDTKALSMWIFNERNNLASMRTLAYQQSETIKVFQQWTKEELMNDKEENGRDIEDIGDKLVKLLDKQTEIEQQYAAKYQQYRHAIKSIRNREDRLSDIREKKRTLSSRIANLTKTSPKSPKLRELEKELVLLDRDTHDTEMEMGDFKRFALKEAFYLRFNAMNEYAEKTAIIAGFGKYIVDLLDIAPTPASESTRRPYEKGKEAAMIFADAINAVEHWEPEAGDERPTIATNTSKYQGTTITDDDSTPLKEDDDNNNNNNNNNSKTPVAVKDVSDSGKGKQIMGSAAHSQNEQETTSPPSSPPINNNTPDTTTIESDTPPQLPPRSPLPATTTTTTSADIPSGYTADAIASVTSDHKFPPPPPQRKPTDLDQLDLYDMPPPAYDETTQQRQHDDNSTPRNSDEPTAVVQDVKQQPQPQQQQEQERQQQEQQSIPDIQEPSTPPLPPAPSSSHVRPITHEDKEQVGDNDNEQQRSTPTIPYQQSPQPMHQYQPSPSSSSPQSQYSYHPPHQHSTAASSITGTPSAMNWNVPERTDYSVSGVEPNYHQGQYQQLYDQLTERQQHGPVQRPYSEFQQQYMMRPSYQQKDAGGFRIPDPSSTPPQPPAAAAATTTTTPQQGASSQHLSADEEKRRLAEKFAMEETQARKASLQTLHQEQKPSSTTSSQKKSVIMPEGEDHGYKSSRRH